MTKFPDSQQTWTVKGDHVHVKHEGLKTFEFEFDFGGTYQHGMFGHVIQFVASKESETKFTSKGKGNGKEFTSVREVVGDLLIDTVSMKDGKTKLIMKFKKQ